MGCNLHILRVANSIYHVHVHVHYHPHQPPLTTHHICSNFLRSHVKHHELSTASNQTQNIHHPSIKKMLRRPPTTLTITAEDVAAYEDRRAGEALLAAQQARAAAQAEAQAQQQHQQHGSSSASASASTPTAMDGVQTSPSAVRRARDERIGVSRRR